MILPRPATPQDELLGDNLTIEEMRQLVAQQNEELEREELRRQSRENRKRLDQLRASVKLHGPLIALLKRFRLRPLQLLKARTESASLRPQRVLWMMLEELPRVPGIRDANCEAPRDWDRRQATKVWICWQHTSSA